MYVCCTYFDWHVSWPCDDLSLTSCPTGRLALHWRRYLRSGVRERYDHTQDYAPTSRHRHSDIHCWARKLHCRGKITLHDYWISYRLFQPSCNCAVSKAVSIPLLMSVYCWRPSTQTVEWIKFCNCLAVIVICLFRVLIYSTVLNTDIMTHSTKFTGIHSLHRTLQSVASHSLYVHRLVRT